MLDRRDFKKLWGFFIFEANIRHPNGYKEMDILGVKVYESDVEKALKILKRQIQKDGLFKELKRRSFYEKPSVKEKRKQREAIKKRIQASRFRRQRDAD